MRIAIYPGSFDPFTIGHFDIVKRALSLFDKIIIAIGDNFEKTYTLSIEKRLNRIKDVFAGENRVEVLSYKGLTVEIANKENACCILRGIRNTNDINYEFQMDVINNRLGGIETVYLLARPEYAHVSSSMVRELARYGVDVSQYLPH